MGMNGGRRASSPGAEFARGVAALQERRSEFPDVFIEMRPRRRSLLGEAAGHVLGYVGQITADDYEQDYVV